MNRPSQATHNSHLSHLAHSSQPAARRRGTREYQGAAMKNGWETKTLGEVCQFRGGGTPSKAVERYWLGDIPWVSPKDMKFDVVSDSIDHISQEAFDGIVTAKANAEKNLQNAHALFESYLQFVFTQRSEGWVAKKIGEIAKHSLGKMLDKAKNKGEPQPYLRNINVRWFTFDLSDLLQMPFLPVEKEKYTAVNGRRSATVSHSGRTLEPDLCRTDRLARSLRRRALREQRGILSGTLLPGHRHRSCAGGYRRRERAAKAKIIISSHFNSKQQVFLDFVLAHYVRVGVEELDQNKLTPLLKLKYHDSITDAVADLGKPDEIGKVFTGFQKYRYQVQAAA